MAASWHVPVTVYTFDGKRYVLSGCLTHQVPMRALPGSLDCGTAEALLRHHVELLKAVLQAPAIALCRGGKTTAYAAGGDELPLPLPRMVQGKQRVVRTHEMPCVNLTTHVINFRLRADGRIVLASVGEINCGTCYVAESMSLPSLRRYLRERSFALRKALRDRRLTVEIGAHRTCVYGMEGLVPRRVLSLEDGAADLES